MCEFSLWKRKPLRLNRVWRSLTRFVHNKTLVNCRCAVLNNLQIPLPPKLWLFSPIPLTPKPPCNRPHCVIRRMKWQLTCNSPSLTWLQVTDLQNYDLDVATVHVRSRETARKRISERAFCVRYYSSWFYLPLRVFWASNGNGFNF